MRFDRDTDAQVNLSTKLNSSSVSMSYLNLAVPIRMYLGKHSCMDPNFSALHFPYVPVRVTCCALVAHRDIGLLMR